MRIYLVLFLKIFIHSANATFEKLYLYTGTYFDNLNNINIDDYLPKDNNLYIDYVNDNNLIQTTYEIPIYDFSKDYDKYETKEVKAKVVLPRTFDLFSGMQIGDKGYIYLYLDIVENKTFYINKTKNIVYTSEPNAFFGYCIKPIITVKGDMVIKDGKGIYNNPYHIGNR